MLLSLIVIDNRNLEACQCQRRVVVADCGEPVHMQWKVRNGVGSHVYQKMDEKYSSPPPQPPNFLKNWTNLALLIMYFFTVWCIILRIQCLVVTWSKSLHCSICRNAQCPITNAQLTKANYFWFSCIRIEIAGTRACKILFSDRKATMGHTLTEGFLPNALKTLSRLSRGGLVEMRSKRRHNICTCLVILRQLESFWKYN